jgi:nitrite reductase/ring-hydroxylating ferredoxin subunit
MTGGKALASVKVARESDLGEGKVMATSAGDRPIALYRIGGIVYATDAKCTHANVDLADGRIVGGLIECPLHVAYFDVASGKGMGPPITRDLRTYPVHIEGDDVFIALAADDAQSS